MEVLRTPLDAGPSRPGCVAALGLFDGVHLGHLHLLACAVSQARRRACPSVVLTFDPHPSVVVCPDRRPRLLMTLEQRLEAFRGAGLDLAWVAPFSRAFSELAPAAFLDQLHTALAPVELYVGRAFRFGRERAGTLETLKTWAAASGCDIRSHAFHAPSGGPLSSTRIREALDRGEVDEAAQLLGRPFLLSGVVVEGERRGRHLGYPTLNLAWDQEQVPAWGVYITEVSCSHFPNRRLGLTNVGEKPTFEGLRLTVETFLPDFDGDLYGARVELGFVHRLRPEMRFESVQELTAQIGRDVDHGRAWWEARLGPAPRHRGAVVGPPASR